VLGLILLLQTLVVAVAGPPTSPEYLPIRVAEAYGLFAREGLQLTLRSTRAESGAAEALAQGQADVAATSFEAMLRFGYRAPSPRLVFTLTAAPPVALLVAAPVAGDVRSVKDLAGGKIGFSAPGSPEQTWLQALLAKVGVTPGGVELVSLGTRGVIAALDAGEVKAAFVAEPAASALVHDDRARLLVDLRSPKAVSDQLGAPTVHAGVFVRGDRRPSDRVLTAFARALLAAERLIRNEQPAVLADRLPTPVVGLVRGEFERRVEATRNIYVGSGLTTPEAIAHTTEIIRAHVPLPRMLRLSRPDNVLYFDPLRRALRAR
jgi:NitT/TauT family transport system substrate-binding protein